MDEPCVRDPRGDLEAQFQQCFRITMMAAEFLMAGRVDASHGDFLRIAECGIDEDHKFYSGDFRGVFGKQLMICLYGHPWNMPLADHARRPGARPIIPPQFVAVADDQRVDLLLGLTEDRVRNV